MQLAIGAHGGHPPAHLFVEAHPAEQAGPVLTSRA
eukprot:CAMPEP_0197501204 /NCGR_PEP_ID=MMETSP1312-20131121/483_1 /TAXON_ID=464262 /ORGANISM="Genus nov. species nov., Strain RCC2335" /LENGTH=34 /DNA_ID= /DNA_START= /DNA_END= /DNA_ORIENTATION=